MGLFDVFKKKDCEICGKEVGMFGYKKLEDGEICKDCVKLLSPWFDDRRHSTVAQIKEQIKYREDNRRQLDSFRPTISIGNYYEIKVEVENGVPTRFVIAHDNYLEENADLISFSQVSSFDIDIREHKREQEYRNNEGQMVSYNPPRYEYSYDFYCNLMVNATYFDDINVRINRDTVCLETVMPRNSFAQMRVGNTFDPTLYPEYREYKAMCEQLEEIFRAGMQGTPMAGYAPAAPQTAPTLQTEAAPAPQPAPSVPKFCPNCGAPTEGGKFCQSCGTKF